MKKHATTILLILLAIGLGVWLFVDRDRVTEGEKKRRENAVFSAWRREDLSRIEIAHEGETIVLTREVAPGKEAPWRMASPRVDRCDQAAVERLLTTFEFATISRKAGEGGALGLETPRASGAITMGGLVMRFALGAPSPRPEGSGYFRVDASAPFVVNKELVQTLLQSSDVYRDRTVVPYLSPDLARFEVKREGGGFAIERTGPRTFKIPELGVQASPEALDKVWNALAEMRAESFPKDADADRLTDKPVVTILMTPKDASRPPAELVVGGACPGQPNDVVVLRKTPEKVAACAPRSVLDALRMTPAALAERRPLPLRADEIEELRLEWLGDADAGPASAPKAIEIARKGATFHEREPVDHDLDANEADAAEILVHRIAQALATTVTKPGAEPFTPIARVKARFGEDEAVVEVGPLGQAGDKDVVVLRRVSDGARLEVTPAVARRFLPRRTALRSRQLVAEGRRVNRVVLKCGVPQELVDAGEGLRLVDPKGYETDGEIAAFVDGFTRAKVDAWVSDTVEPSFGLGEDACRVVLGFADGKDPMILRLGKEGESGVFATVEGDPSVFVVPRSQAELAKAIYVSRATLRVPAAEVGTVRVTVDGKPIARVDPSVMASLFAERVTRFGKGAGTSDVGRPEIVIDATIADGGAPKHVVCGALATDGTRPCALEGLAVTYRVGQGRIARLLGQLPGPDAGAADAEVAPDGGPR